MAREPTGDEAFRTFAVEPPYQIRSMRKLLQSAVVDQSQQIAEGYAKDWGDYTHRTGVVEGLKIALQFCDDMEKAERK